jgi:hypothetical protein
VHRADQEARPGDRRNRTEPLAEPSLYCPPDNRSSTGAKTTTERAASASRNDGPIAAASPITESGATSRTTSGYERPTVAAASAPTVAVAAYSRSSPDEHGTARRRHCLKQLCISAS